MNFSTLPPYHGFANEAPAKYQPPHRTFDEIFVLVFSISFVGAIAMLVLAHVLAFGSGPPVQN
jgi:hypothetical protein